MTDSSEYVLVIAEGEPLLFTGRESAGAYMEPEDVEAGCYEAYDTSGGILPIRVEKAMMPGLFGVGQVCVDVVRVGPREGELADGVALAKRIVEYVRQVRQGIFKAESLGDAMALLEREVGVTR